jgi:hypothetical protein
MFGCGQKDPGCLSAVEGACDPRNTFLRLADHEGVDPIHPQPALGEGGLRHLAGHRTICVVNRPDFPGGRLA